MAAKSRDAVFQPEFREDLKYWVETDRRTAIKVFSLIEAVLRDPFERVTIIDTPTIGRQRSLIWIISWERLSTATEATSRG